MHKTFAFVFMGALGFTAAVGATSFGTAIISFEDGSEPGDIPDGPVLGFDLTSKNARIVAANGGNAVLLPLDPSEDETRGATLGDGIASALRLDRDGELFVFESVDLASFDLFDFEETDDLSLRVASDIGLDVTGTGPDFSFSAQVAGLIADRRTFRAAEIGDGSLAGKPLSNLTFSTPGGGSDGFIPLALPVEGATLFFPVADTGVVIDDIVLSSTDTPAPVPVPATALLLFSAFLGAGLWYRPKPKAA